MKSEPKPASPRPQLHPCDFGPHWNSVYYDVIQEYYWDPKLIGRVPAVPPIFANDKEMLGNLRRMEVSLNHLLALFFSLAPQDYISGLESTVFGDTTDKAYRNIGIFELRRTTPHDPTQPDVFMASADTCFSVEVKIGAKSSLEQVVKYALLHCWHEKKEGKPLASRLLYLTPRPEGKTWAENFTDVGCMKAALDAFDFNGFLEKTKMSKDLTAAELEAASRSLQVAHITFARFHEITKTYAGAIPPGERYADSARKIIDGLVHELEFRGDLLGIK
jgi:hypothetical protein